MSKSLTIGLGLTSRTILWLGGILALLGLLWRPPIETSLFLGCLTALTLAAWVEFLILFSLISQKPKYFIGDHELLIPAFFFGFLLPLPFPILYIALLGTAEIVRQIFEKKLLRKNFTLPIPLEDRSGSEEELSDEKNNDSITQQIVRHHTEAGTDRLEASYLVEFRNDQLTATIHVPFYPTFEFVPKIEIFCIDNVEIKWNVFEPRNFGVRIDIKRSSRETSRIRIMVVAECSKPTVF